MKDYVRLIASFEPEDNEVASEIIIAALNTIDFESYEIKDNQVYAYIPALLFDEDQLKGLTIFHNPFFKDLTYAIEIIKEKNWNEIWEKKFL